MMPITTSREQASPPVEAYVRRCVAYFDDLPVDEQASLEHDVREIVAEVTAELDGDPADLVGPPERFAAELRSAAGLPPRAVPADLPWHDSGQASPLSILVRWLRDRAVPWCREFLDDLRPAWWVARGLALTGLLSSLVDPHSEAGLPWVPIGGAIVLASVQFGRSGKSIRGSKRLVLGAISVAVVLAIGGSVFGSDDAYADFADPTEEIHSLDEWNEPGEVQAHEQVRNNVHLHVQDVETGNTVWESTAPSPRDLATILEVNSLEAAGGFRFEFTGPFGHASGQVPTWDALVEVLNAYDS